MYFCGVLANRNQTEIKSNKHSVRHIAEDVYLPSPRYTANRPYRTNEKNV